MEKLEGSFKGVKEADVDEPAFYEEGRYETVKYGWLYEFSLYVPRGSKVETARSGIERWFLVRTPAGKEYGFLVVKGDAYVPSAGSMKTPELVKRKIEEIRKREQVIKNAKLLTV